LETKSKEPIIVKDAGRLIEICGKFSGGYEKTIRMVVGILKSLEEKGQNYADLSRNPLSSNIEYVQKRNPLLVRGFSVVIRNSISHDQYFVRSSTNTIDFQDSKETLTVSFEEMVERCKSLFLQPQQF
jgi:hypothetical protein